jgi:small-conductance mechanosensitive channel
VAGFALAFGLGGRDAARAMTAGRIVRQTYEPGQTVVVAGVRGEIVEVEAAATVLRTSLGLTVRVPNHLMVESVVELHDGRELQ